MPHHTPDDATRLLTVTPGNVRQNHLYVRGLYDFFPPDCIGPSRKAKNGRSHEINSLRRNGQLRRRSCS